MITNIISAAIAALASVVVVWYTQYRAKQMAFFQTYFNRKLDAYAAYWAALCEYEQNRTTEAWTTLIAKTHLVALFAPEDIYVQALNLAGFLCEHAHPDGTSIERLTNAMRKDLELCKQMRFSTEPYVYDEDDKSHK